MAQRDASILLWSQLLKSFDMTTSLGAEHRFPVIAKSLRTILLDDTRFNNASKFLKHQEGFTYGLIDSLRVSWCAHRDAYLLHGSASPLLGKASHAAYTFLRHTLGVPVLATEKLRTSRL